MKLKNLGMWMLPIAASGLIVTGCVVEPDGRVYMAPPAVVVAPPPPPVVVEPAPVVLVPDTYVWDGFEFVGFVGGTYVYLGPRNVWVECDEVRITRFHEYERVHPDWRVHATVNVNFRTDRYGHEAPRRDYDRRPPERRRAERREDRR